MKATMKEDVRIRNSCVGLGAVFGMLMYSSIPGFNVAIKLVLPEDLANHAFCFMTAFSVLAFTTMALLHSLVKGAIHIAAGCLDTSPVTELLNFVEYRFAAGALIFSSISWVGSDLFNGVALQMAHSIIIYKLLIAAWCLRTPSYLEGMPLENRPRQSTCKVEETDSCTSLV